MSFDTSVIWLRTGTAILMVIGVIFALAAWPPTAFAATFFMDFIVWPADGAQSLLTTEIRTIDAASGGMMIGWGVMLWLLIDRLYPSDPAQFRAILFASIGTWFVVDSAASLVAGGFLNVGLNILFLLIFFLPLLLVEQSGL